MTVAKPPNGTSGATISLPSLALTVASTVAVTPNSDAVPLSVRRPSEDGTGTTDCRIGIDRRRSASVTSAVPTSWLPRLRSAASRTVSRPELNSCAEASSEPTSEVWLSRSPSAPAPDWYRPIRTTTRSAWFQRSLIAGNA